MSCRLNAQTWILDITCITAGDDEDAASLVGEVLLSEGRGANEEALAESIHVGSHDFLLYGEAV
jgi:hypothetical protein